MDELADLIEVKAIGKDDGEWLVDVRGLPFGGPFNGRDADKQFFDEDTKTFLEDNQRKVLVVHYHGFKADGTFEFEDDPDEIGKEISREKRQDGWWFRIALDKTKDIARDMWQAAKNGTLRASSGAIAHLRRMDKNINGRVSLWPVAELSLMDISKGTYPANPYAVAMPVLQKRFKAAGLNFDPVEAEAAESAQLEVPELNKTEQLEEVEMTEQVKDQKPLSLEDIEAFLEKRDAQKAEQARIAQLEQQAEEYKALKQQIEDAAKNKEDDGRKQIKRLSNPVAEQEDDKPQIEVYSKWDGYSIGQLGLAWDMLKAVGADRPAAMYRAMHAKALKQVKSGNVYDNHITRNAKGEIIRELNPAVTAKAVKAITTINPMQMAGNAIKADEAHGSDVTDAGDEWVPALWSAELWDLVRNEARVMRNFRQVEVPGESLTIPTLEGKTTVYKTAQTDDASEIDFANTPATSSKVTTGNVTLTPVKNVAWLIYTGELNEDSILPVLPTLQSSLQMDLMEQIDEMIVSGDTDTTTNNISDNGNGSIATTWHLLSFNGLRDYALGNSKATDIAGSPTAEDFLTVMGLLGTAGAFALDPDKLIWISDPAFYRTIMSLGEVLTRDKYAPATVENGRIMQMFGSPFIVSDRYGKTDTSGYINNTAASNTKGSFLCVRPDRWVLGFGRQIRIESPARSAVDIVSDVNHLIASFRLDFKQHSASNGAALGYDVTVL